MKKILFVIVSVVSSSLTPAYAEWRYSSSADPMGRGSIDMAVIESENTIDLQFPYAGPQKATFQVRKHFKYGIEYLIYIDKGQFLCRYKDCNVSVKLDDEKPITVKASEPEDNQTTALFLELNKGFIEKLKKSKKLLIEAGFYNNGVKMLEFKTEGFNISNVSSIKK